MWLLMVSYGLGWGGDSGFSFPLPDLLSQTIPRTLLSAAQTDVSANTFHLCALKYMRADDWEVVCVNDNIRVVA